MKKKKCKNCGTLFQPNKPLQYICNWHCATDYAKNLNDKKEAKEWKEKKAIKKKELMSKSDYIKILQILVNKYVRKRDGNFCISCDKPVNGKIDCGHFFSVGNYPSVRFDLRNLNSQCIRCNQYNGGSLHEYRKNLIKKIGQEEFDELDKLAHQNRQFDLEEIKEMIKKYKELTK